MSKNVLSVFSSRSFMVLCLIFMFLKHFEFIFVYSVRKCSNFIVLHEADHLSQKCLFKRFSALYIFASFVINQLTIDVWVFFWALHYVLLLYMSVFVPVLCCCDYCSLQQSLKSERRTPPALFIFLRIALAILGPLWYHKFQDYSFQCCRKCHRCSDRNCIKYVSCFEYYDHFNNNSSNPRTYDIPPFLESFTISFVYILSFQCVGLSPSG